MTTEREELERLEAEAEAELEDDRAEISRLEIGLKIEKNNLELLEAEHLGELFDRESSDEIFRVVDSIELGDSIIRKIQSFSRDLEELRERSRETRERLKKIRGELEEIISPEPKRAREMRGILG